MPSVEGVEWLSVLEASINYFGATVSQLDDAHSTVPRACGEWGIAEVVHHVTTSNRWVAAVLRGEDPTEPPALPENSREDLVKAWGASATKLQTEFGLGLERRVRHPLGLIPAESLVLFRCTEQTIHGWDIRRAAAIDSEIPSTLVTPLLEAVRPIALMLAGTGQYGLPVLDPDAGPTAELLGWFGRKA